MGNPNNCKTCDYTKLNANREGHCYMFRDEPDDVCMQHTGRKLALMDFATNLAAQQVPLGEEFSRVLDENLWDLYERT